VPGSLGVLRDSSARRTGLCLASRRIISRKLNVSVRFLSPYGLVILLRVRRTAFACPGLFSAVPPGRKVDVLLKSSELAPLRGPASQQSAK
jgi:hypothetical protein